MTQNTSQLIIYQTESGETKIDVRLEKETVWLTQKPMADLFGMKFLEMFNLDLSLHFSQKKFTI